MVSDGECDHGSSDESVPNSGPSNRVGSRNQRGDVTQMSFAFEVIRQEWDERPDTLIRTIIEARLHDVSVVTFPAYTETDAAVRSELVIPKTEVDHPGPRRAPARLDRSLLDSLQGKLHGRSVRHWLHVREELAGAGMQQPQGPRHAFDQRPGQ